MDITLSPDFWVFLDWKLLCCWDVLEVNANNLFCASMNCSTCVVKAKIFASLGSFDSHLLEASAFLYTVTTSSISWSEDLVPPISHFLFSSLTWAAKSEFGTVSNALNKSWWNLHVFVENYSLTVNYNCNALWTLLQYD